MRRLQADNVLPSSSNALDPSNEHPKSSQESPRETVIGLASKMHKSITLKGKEKASEEMTREDSDEVSTSSADEGCEEEEDELEVDQKVASKT
jgi:hypothetical protein